MSYLILLVIILLGLTFASLNAGQVDFNYYLSTRSISLSLLLVYALGAGLVLGILVTVPAILKVKKESFQLKKRLKQAESEISNLRTIPVKNEHTVSL